MKSLDRAKNSIIKLLSPAVAFDLASYFLVFILAVLVAGCGSGSESESGGGGDETVSLEPVAIEPVDSIVAKTGPIIAVRVSETVTLNGSKSHTSPAAPLSFSWSFSHKPDASNALLQGETTETPSFTPDVKGVYMVQLVVSVNGISSTRSIQSVVVSVAPERLTGAFNHPGLSSDCVNCHNGELIDPGKSPNHIASSNMCQACHTPQGAAIIPFVDHLEVFGNCSECHNGITAIGKSVFHAPTDAECDDCHNTSSFLALAVDGSFDHTNISQPCSACHNGTVSTGKTATSADTPPGSHPITDTECGYCHTTTGFLPAYPDHTDPAVVGNGCESCHNGSTAAGPSAGHPETKVDCAVCHNIETFSLGGIFDHSVIDSASQPCADCHNDNNTINAPGKATAVPTHIATNSDCGSCHNTGTFVGAFVDHTDPDVANRSCDACHGVTTIGKSPNHMPTSEDCSICHTPGTFTSGSFSHGTAYIAPPALCTDCHNNAITVGKLVNHLPTTEECSVCHSTTGFVPATFDHVGIVDNCESCHNGNISSGKTFNHLPTDQDCSVCHTTTTIDSSPAPFKDTQNVHSGITGNCESCHSGNSDHVAVGAIGKLPDHIPAQNKCDVCHKDTTTGGFAASTTFISDVHSALTQGCEGCHVSKFLPTANSKPNIIKTASHLPTDQDCDVCHTNTAFTPSIFDHLSITDNCVSCHDGSQNNTTAGAPGKTSTHPATTQECGVCHGIGGGSTGGTFADASFDHSGRINNCSECHGDNTTGAVTRKNPGHVPTTQDCSLCHIPGTFTTAVFDHTGIVNNCVSCHDGSGAIATVKNNIHLPTTDDCSVCHNTTAFIGAKYDHTGILNNCTSCHDGVTARGKIPNHVPTNDDCSNCHQATGFVPATFDHVGIVDNCTSCHGAGFATGKTDTHVATNKDCSVCHNTQAFIGAVFDHTGIQGNCVSCHDGKINTGKALNHLPTDQDCSVCHTYTTISSSPAPFKDTQNVHSGITGNCESCHSGNPDHVAVGAIGKLPDHIPALDECIVCHKDTAMGGFASSATFMNDVHSGLNQGCEGCHDSKFLPTTNSVQNIIKTTNHLSTNQDCYLCHTITSFLPDIFTHKDITGKCASCHDGGTKNVAIGARGATNTTLHQSTNEDCGTCHNTTAFLGAFVDHSGPEVVGKRCDACHDGGTGGAIGKNTDHLPTTQDCAVCHVAGGTFIPAVFDHTGITGNCASCHNGVAATGLTPAHIPTDGKDCSVCHNTTAFIGARFDHTGIVNNCTSCHNDVTARGKSPGHVPTSGDCSNCHQTTGFLPATFDHVGIVDNCASCHGSGFAIDKSVNHVATDEDCSVCHNSSTFIGAVFDHTGIVDNCVSCHNGLTTIDKPLNHIPTTDDCSVCHNTTDFIGATFDHTGTIDNCSSCHNGVATRGKSPNHIATSNNCESCHLSQDFAIIPSVDHLEVFGNCSECHNGITAIGKSVFHAPTNAECDNCHKTSSFLELAPDGSYDHSNILRSCSGCHNGTISTGKTDIAIHNTTNAECGSCHTTTGFLPAYPDHTDPAVLVNGCNSCHNDISAQGPSPGHPIVSVDCDTCHSIVTFNMAGVFNHSLLDPAVQSCESCHNDNTSINAPSKSSAASPHIATASDCGSCHNTITFIGAFVDHTDPDIANRSCDSCHGATTIGKSPNHMPTSEDCSVCHTPGTFTSGTFSHGPEYISLPAHCSDCHNNVITVGKLINHLPTNGDCGDCHLTTSFLPAAFDHTGINGNCLSCHDGNTSTGKALNHLPTDQDCSDCHTHTTIGSSTAPFKDTQNVHTGITGNCESCHSGNPDYVAIGAIGKLPDHIPALNECFVCHKDTATSGFASSATFMSSVHSGLTQGCEGCHVNQFLPTANSNPNIIKAASHLPTVQDCYLCHTISSFIPSMFAHTGITGNCASCHDGSVNNVAVGARGASNTTLHQNTNEDCATCHNTTTFLGAFVDHNGANVVGKRCDSCHNGIDATGKDAKTNPPHVTTNEDCEVCHVAGGAFVPSVFDHTGITNNCASCHDGVSATGLTATHLPIDARDCSVCHNTTAFIGAKYDHTGIVNNCASCHDGVTASGKAPPPDHVPTNGDCSNCHQTTGFVPATFDHIGIVDNCTSCHGAGFAVDKPATHIPTSQDCGVCHNTRTFIGATVDHAGIVNGCESCHDGITATGKSAKTNPAHFDTGLDCHNCHTTATFLGGTWIHDSSSTGNCDQCHSTGSGARSKPAGHLSTNVQCDECHSTDGWAPSIFSHNRNGNYPGDHRIDPGCSGCHGNTISLPFNYPFNQYAPDCAACHAGDFESESDHNGGKSGTVEQNKNCAGSGCHRVGDDGF